MVTIYLKLRACLIKKPEEVLGFKTENKKNSYKHFPHDLFYVVLR
jgi:hypothetical protein